MNNTETTRPTPEQTTTLTDDRWVSLRRVHRPDAGIAGYVYAHETRCAGQIIAVLPFQDTPAGRLYLVRSDVTPCWGSNPELSSVTGGWEGGPYADDVVREMAEETGYTVTTDMLIPLGTSYAGKASDTVYHLFAVDVTGLTPGPAHGDGSRLEAEGIIVWVDTDQISDIPDPQVSVMWMRLEKATRPPIENDSWTDSVDDLIAAAWGLIAGAWNIGDPPREPLPGWNDAARRWRERYHKHIRRHPEHYCHRHGGPFRPWTAPSPLWNEVIRAGCINGRELFDGIVCPNCFMDLAEEQGVATRWRLWAEKVSRQLQTVTPSGRVWNPDTWMFDDPPGTPDPAA